MLRKLVLAVFSFSLVAPISVYAIMMPVHHGGGSTMNYSTSIKTAKVQKTVEVEEEMICGIKAKQVERIQEKITNFAENDLDFSIYLMFRLDNRLLKANPNTKHYCLMEMLSTELHELLDRGYTEKMDGTTEDEEDIEEIGTGDVEDMGTGEVEEIGTGEVVE